MFQPILKLQQPWEADMLKLFVLSLTFEMPVGGTVSKLTKENME